MKRIIAILFIIITAAVLIINPAAATYQQASFDGGTLSGSWGGTYNNRRLNVLYTTTSGTIFSGMGTHYTTTGTNYTQYQFPFNSFIGWNSTTNTLQTTNLVGGIEYADQTSVDYETHVVLSSDIDTDAVVVRYTYGTDEQSVFIGEFGHMLGDDLNPLYIYAPNPSGNTSVRLVGTYHIYDYTANDTNGRPSYTTVDVKKTVKPYDTSTGEYYSNVKLDPVSTASFDTDQISWYFVGQVGTANVGGVSYVAEYSTLQSKYNITATSSFNHDLVFSYNTSSDYDSISEQFIELVVESGLAPDIPDDVMEITVNGRYNVLGKEYVDVNVPQNMAESAFGWLLDVGGAALQFEIAPGYTIGGIFTFVVGFALIIWLLKVFLGG